MCKFEKISQAAKIRAKNLKFNKKLCNIAVNGLNQPILYKIQLLVERKNYTTGSLNAIINIVRRKKSGEEYGKLRSDNY